MENKLINNFVQQLKNNNEGSSWLDENFSKKLENVTEKNAFIRPLPEIHSVAELAAHILIWRVEGIKKLQGFKSYVTVDSPENWRTNEELKTIGWKKLKAGLLKSQTELVNLLADKTDAYLEENDYVPGYSYKYLVEGLIHHDIYHLGQIGITLKLLHQKEQS